MRPAFAPAYVAAVSLPPVISDPGRGPPVDDLGVRQGYALAWGLEPAPTPKELVGLGERFRPYRSVVARYCWEAVALFRGGTDPSLR
jgi:hypothetical protein